MTVNYRKQRERWSFHFEVNKQRHAGYCLNLDGTPARNRKEAEQAEARERVRVETQPAAPAHTTAGETLAQSFARYVTVCAAKRLANLPKIKGYTAEAMAHFGELTQSATIGPDTCWKWIKAMQDAPVTVWIGGPDATRAQAKQRTTKTIKRERSPITINHRLKALSAALNLAYQTRNALTGQPMIPHKPSVPMLDVPERLPQPLSNSNRDAITEELRKTAPHAADAVTLASHVGLRLAEVLGLTLYHVRDLDSLGAIRLDAEETKGGRDARQPVNSVAMPVLRRLIAQAKERGSKFLITYAMQSRDARGALVTTWVPVASIKTAWNKAAARLQIDNRFHDTKGNFSTNLARVASGRTVQLASRHKSYKTTEKYLSLVDPDMAAAVEAIATLGDAHADPQPAKNRNQKPQPARNRNPAATGGKPKLVMISKG